MSVTIEREPKTSPPAQDDMRDFLIVVRRALLLIIQWIECRYELPARVSRDQR